MRAVRGKDTKPELVVRRLLHRMRYRYRLHDRSLPGKPDIAFRSRHAVVEVRGCWWHAHDDPACRKASLPATRIEWWRAKLARNVERDRRNEAALAALGWKLLVVWECEIGKTGLADRLSDFLGPPSPSRSSIPFTDSC